MGKVRWAGWTMAVATAFVMSSGQAARADIASDKPAAIVVYPDVVVQANTDTVIRLTNTNQTTPIDVHCFYVNANLECASGVCVPKCQETDFNIVLTEGQPIEWLASDGLADDGLPLAFGVCQRNPFQACGSNDDCNPRPGGNCTHSNAGTRIPPVPENPFRGELKCIAVDATGAPVARNDLKGEGLIERFDTDPAVLDVASYNAIGIQAVAGSATSDNVLTLGGTAGEYNGCPNFLILNHFFDGAADPVPGTDNEISTNLVLVPCSEDLLRQIPGAAVVQYLVFNEFEQRFSTSRKVTCFQDLPLCNIDTPSCGRSIFNVAVAGTLTGQTRMNAIGVAPLPSGLLGVAVEHHNGDNTDRSAAFNLHMQGSRSTADTITLP
jgi:hypothetical protein